MLKYKNNGIYGLLINQNLVNRDSLPQKSLLLNSSLLRASKSPPKNLPTFMFSVELILRIYLSLLVPSF